MSLELNAKMPYMRFNWAMHSARTGRLSWEERGIFDAVRCELWAVVGCRMPLAHLCRLLRIEEASEDARRIQGLIALGLLTVDAEGVVGEPVQVAEFAAAVELGKINAANGKKGGRPPKLGPDHRSEF